MKGGFCVPKRDNTTYFPRNTVDARNKKRNVKLNEKLLERAANLSLINLNQN
jgi:hypothetical protein